MNAKFVQRHAHHMVAPQPGGIPHLYRIFFGHGALALTLGAFVIGKGSMATSTNAPQTNDLSVPVSFFESKLLSANYTYQPANFFATNRVVSALNSNLPATSPQQGHFINVSMREWDTNVFMFGTGEYPRICVPPGRRRPA